MQDECDDMDVDGYDDFSDDAGITAHENALGSSSCIISAVHYALTVSQCDQQARPCFDVMPSMSQVRLCLAIQHSTCLH